MAISLNFNTNGRTEKTLEFFSITNGDGGPSILDMNLESFMFFLNIN